MSLTTDDMTQIRTAIKDGILETVPEIVRDEVKDQLRIEVPDAVDFGIQKTLPSVLEPLKAYIQEVKDGIIMLEEDAAAHYRLTAKIQKDVQKLTRRVDVGLV